MLNLPLCNCFQDFRHVHSPKASLIGASENSLAERSSGSLHDLADVNHSDRSSERLASNERLAASSSSAAVDDAGDGDDVEYDDDR